MDEEADFQLPGIPKAKPGDHEDVSWALSAAETMWSRGEHREAIKWLRRSAEAAADQDVDARALELAKAAAELAALIANGSPTEESQIVPPIARPSKPPPPKPAIEDLSDVALLDGDSTLQGMQPMRTQPMSATPSSPPPAPPATRPSQAPPRPVTAPLAAAIPDVRPSQPPVAPRVGTQRTQPLQALAQAATAGASPASTAPPESVPPPVAQPSSKPRSPVEGEALTAKDILRRNLAAAARAIPGAPEPFLPTATAAAAPVAKTVLSAASAPAAPTRASSPPPAASGAKATPSNAPLAPPRPMAQTVPHGAALAAPAAPKAASQGGSAQVPPPPETDPVPTFDRTTETPALGPDDFTAIQSAARRDAARPSGKERAAKAKKRTKSRTSFDDSDATVIAPLESERGVDSITSEHLIATGPDVPPASSRPVERTPLIGTPRTSSVQASQAVRVILWKDSTGVHVAPAGTVVNAIGVEAMLVALDPTADLNAWLDSKPPRAKK